MGIVDAPVTGRHTARSAEVEEFLTRHPDAAVIAMGENGLTCAMPVDAPIGDHPIVTGVSSALELVRPDHIRDVIEAWKQCLLTGSAAVEAGVHGGDDARVGLSFFDVRERCGAVLGVAVWSDGIVRIGHAAETDRPLRPRVSVIRKNTLAEIIDIDEAFTAMLGFSADEVLGKPNLEHIHPDDQDRAVATWLDMLAAPARSRRARIRQRHRDGRWIWFEVTNHNRLDEPGENAVVCELLDISDEMAAHEAARARGQLLERLTDSLPLGVVQVDGAGQVVHSNARTAQLMGVAHYSRAEDIFANVVGPDSAVLSAALQGVLHDARDADLEVALDTGRGVGLRCRVTLRVLTDDERRPTGALICLEDVTEGARLRAQLEHRATYDALTRTRNRASIVSTLEQALTDAAHEDTGVVVVFIDLDGFKSVNDRRGHAAGDALLCRIADCLREAMRDNDSVGRFGGDEFLVVARGVRTSAQALALARRLAQALADAVDPEPPHAAVASIGVTWTTGARTALDDDATHEAADELIRLADAAMYRSKAEGLGRPALLAAP